MACTPHSLSVLSYADGFTLWVYKTSDDVHGVMGPGYFDGAADMLRAGDKISVSTPLCGFDLFVQCYKHGHIHVKMWGV